MSWIVQGKTRSRLIASAGYENGKQRRVICYVRHPPELHGAKLKKWLKEQNIMFQKAVDNGDYPPLLFSALVEKWFDEYVFLRLKKHTIETYQSTSKIVLDYFGCFVVKKITTCEVQKFLNSLTENRTTKTVKNYKAFLSGVFRWAVVMGYCSQNPCVGTFIPRGASPKILKVYTTEELQNLIIFLVEMSKNGCFVDKQSALYCLLLIFSGARKGEIAALTWADVDIERGLICINKSLYKQSADIPKTKSSNRVLTVSSVVMEILQQFKAVCQNVRENCYIFVGADGEAVGENKFYSWLLRRCKKIGVPFWGLHAFRHCYASALIEGGENAVTVSALLGHSNVTTTLNIYSHAFAVSEARRRTTDIISNMYKLEV